MALALTCIYLPVAFSTQTLQVPHLWLTLVLQLSVQAHEPGPQLWLTYAPSVLRRMLPARLVTVD